jgi:hypothetical protein
MMAAGVQSGPEVTVDPAAAKDVTTLLLEWSEGNPDALNQLTPLVYEELRRLAARQLRKERGDHTRQRAGQVHEVYLKLVDKQRVRWHDRDHFFTVASRMIRPFDRIHRPCSGHLSGYSETRLERRQGVAVPPTRQERRR